MLGPRRLWGARFPISPFTRAPAFRTLPVSEAMTETLTELTIEGRSSGRLGERVRELWAHREVVLAFAERNNLLKYKQAAFGIAWSVLQPLTFLAVFFVIFGRLARVSGGGSSYAAFAFAALVPWFFVQNSVSFGAQALLNDSSLLRKVYFPREASVLGAVLSSGVDFGFGLVLLLVLEPFLGGRLSWSVIAVVPLWLMLAAMASGVAMLLGALNVYYRDFRFLLPVMLQLWMFSSPVAYPLTTIREQWRMLYVTLNPAAAVLDGFRRVLSQGQWPDPGVTAIGAAGALLLLLAGYWVFKSMEPGFADAV
jgi:ABC-type polysaccharide/polyol phosphate export permease